MLVYAKDRAGPVSLHIVMEGRTTKIGLSRGQECRRLVQAIIIAIGRGKLKRQDSARADRRWFLPSLWSDTGAEVILRGCQVR